MSMRRLRSVTRKYPFLKEYYPFMRRAERAAKNRFLAAGEVRRFIASFEKKIPDFADAPSVKEALGKETAAYFAASAPSDRLLNLLEDALAAALTDVLFFSKEDDREAFSKLALDYTAALEETDFEEIYLRCSSVERILSARDFLHYTESDRESREEIKKEVFRFARRCRTSDRKAAETIERADIEHRKKCVARFYTALLCALPPIAAAAVWLSCGPLPALLLLLPTFTVSVEIVMTAASLFVRPAPILKTNEKAIERPVLVTVTVLLTSAEDVREQCRRLKRMLLQNPEKGITFALLADLPEAASPHTPEDDALEKTAVREISALNAEYPRRFALFLRKRTLCPTQGAYMGWERKRGALIELVRLIKGEPTTFKTVICEEDLPARTKYLLTLDADTELSIGAVMTLYRAMRHRENRPVIENGVVVSGYGVLQPRMATDVDSAAKTPFASLMSGGGGSDSYRSAVFDFCQSVYGRGAFCGKGMFDVDVFHEVIDGAFPDGRILSHDLLEGTRLRCGYLSELTLSDSCPSTAHSFYKRQHRWARGDFQALPFAFFHLPFRAQGEKRRKNPIDALSKYMIVSNVTRALTPVCSLAALLLSPLLAEDRCAVFLLFSFAYLLFPLVTAILRTARFVHRRFYSAVLQNVWQGVFTALYSLSALPYYAQLTLDAALRTLYRSAVSGKKLLEWTTAGEGEKLFRKKTFSASLLFYAANALPALAAAAALLIFSRGGILRLSATIFLLFPLEETLLSLPYPKKKGVSPAKRAALIRWAVESFSYFERFVTEKEHFLPPDNYEEHPVSVIARRTSPTNIALYLTSVAAMHDLGLMKEDEMLTRIEQTVGTLAALPKYRGHLYNWYSTETLEILGAPYISTVDSGNLAAGLLTVRNALLELDGERARALAARISSLLEKTDFSFLFNNRKKLLCIGYDPLEERQSSNCYDLLASEARTAYYFAVAAGQIPRASFAALGRPVTAKDGHIGLLSFSGTAFEYLMPSLFLPLYPNTLLYEALFFALYEQERDRAKGVWGRSESCYYAFDDQMNYQYRAFGAASLALDPTTGRQNVVAPYASFLALALAPDKAAANLKKMEERGLKGRYGFYEAVDFTPARVGRGAAVIRAYMAHHVGMSVTAVANACLDNIFVRRFMADERMDAAAELLKERIPTDSRVAARVRRRNPRPPRFSFAPRPQKAASLEENADAVILSEGSARAVCAGDGRFELSFGDLLLTPPLDAQLQPEDRPTLGLFFGEGAVTVSRGASFFSDGQKLVFSASCKDALLRAEACAAACGWIFSLSGRTRVKDARAVFFAALPFCRRDEYFTHPAYPALFVSSEYAPDERALIFEKRSAQRAGSELFAAFAFADGREFSFAARGDDLPPLPFDPAFSKGGAPKTDRRLFSLPSVCGPARSPCALISAPLGEAGEFVCELIIAVSTKKEEVFAQIAALRAMRGKRTLPERLSLAGRRARAVNAERPDKALLDGISLFLQGIFRKRAQDLPLPSYPIGELWRSGISGDCPIFCFYLQEKPLSGGQKKIVRQLLTAHAALARAGAECDLVFLRREREAYFSPARKELEALISECVGSGRLGRRGGVHLLFDERAEKVLPSFARVSLAIEKDCIFQSLRLQFLSQLSPIEAPPVSVPARREEGRFALPCGSFTDGGFLVNKARRPYSPFSMIYASKQFGTLLTDRSLGFTWLRNSGELRLTPFSGNERSGLTGEKLLLTLEDRRYDLCALSETALFGFDCARYEGKLDGLSYALCVGVHEKLPVKLLLLTVRNRTPGVRRFSLNYAVVPALGRTADGQISSVGSGDAHICKRTALTAEHDFGMYAAPAECAAELKPGEERSFVFHLGAVNLKNDRCFYHVRARLSAPEEVARAFAGYRKSLSPFLDRFTVRTGDREADEFVSKYLPYQILTARLYGRTGFFQPGGAYGFRDQLQDALSMLPCDPSLLKIQLLRAAAHQYAEGDVQHWWHRVDAIGKSDAGVRTHCSDDLLWLPFACARYLAFTGDAALLEKEIFYLSSLPPANGKDRYERPQKTARRESLYEHCLRALDLALARRSERGLCLMGSGDWNDGLSALGGESVWLTQFLALTLRAFLPFAREPDRARFAEAEKECLAALKGCLRGKTFLRAIAQNGAEIGKKGCSYDEIDLLPQCFAVFLDEKSPAGKEAILRAYDKLWDGERRLFRLFAPSCDRGSPFPGYLAGYCPGFRENGGQYTHAAVWGAMALLRAGAYEKGYEVLRGLCPVTHCKKDFETYALEPYALAGDVYYAAGFEGRGGWSHYTGAAGWYLTAFLEELLGYTERNGGFSLFPRLPASLPTAILTVRKNGSVYRVTLAHGGKYALLLDGRPAENRFLFDGETHEIRLILPTRTNVRVPGNASLPEGERGETF